MVSDEFFIKVSLICIILVLNHIIIEKKGQRFPIMYIGSALIYLMIGFQTLIMLEDYADGEGIGYIMIAIASIKAIYNVFLTYKEVQRGMKV